MYSLARIGKAVAWFMFGKPMEKRRVRQELARVCASAFGDYYIGEDHKLWRKDKEFFARYQRLSPGNPYSQERKFLLRELVRSIKTIPGAMAECGCYQGCSAWFMANEKPDSALHLFDSFEGLSAPGGSDQTTDDDVLEWKPGDLRASEAGVRRALADFQHVYLYKGWIPERFDEVAKESFSFVHIDVDLYQPTLDSLAFFYPRMHTRGVIVLDDFGFATCPGAHQAVSEFMRDKPESVIHSPTGQGIIIKQ